MIARQRPLKLSYSDISTRSADGTHNVGCTHICRKRISVSASDARNQTELETGSRFRRCLRSNATFLRPGRCAELVPPWQGVHGGPKIRQGGVRSLPAGFVHRWSEPDLLVLHRWEAGGMMAVLPIQTPMPHTKFESIRSAVGTGLVKRDAD